MGIFSGKQAVVIGGSGGIGCALCRKLVAAGADVTVHGGHDSVKFDSFLEELQSLASEILKTEKRRDYPSVCKSVIDLSSFGFEETCAGKLFSLVENADILCICFGPFVQKKFAETTLQDWQSMALLNYALPGFCVSSALPSMIKKHWGRILLFGGTRTFSINGFLTNPAYAGAKTGVCSLVRSVAAEYAACGITCNAILPGFVETEYLSEEAKIALRRKMPDGCLISVDSIADSALFLLSASERNGILLNVDDGWNGGLAKS